MVGLKRHSSFACYPASLFLCVFFLSVARGCSGLYFYAYDYASWVSTVTVFRNTSILKESGWLQLNPYTNATVGRALYKTTFEMQNSTNGSLSSFKTSFVFSMNTDRGKEYFGDGLAFLICPNPFRGEDLQVSSGGYLGMFNSSTVGMLKNKVFAVEFDTHQNLPFKDPNDNHIGVDLNSVISLKTNNLSSLGIILNEGKKIICWVDYDGVKRYLWVYLALSPSNKPIKPAISMALDLAPYMKDNMYVGFTSATGTRAELHTIYSWWFLSGFGNLTFPVSPSSSTRPLARLGQRNIVITVFSLVVMVVFLCLLCIFARRCWQRQYKHLIDILLPVACWMFWKESITCEVRSTRCLKLATPTVELLAWLWRTRFAREHDQLFVKSWSEVLLKRKMRPYHRGEAWHLEDKRRKRRKSHGAVHVLVYEEPNDEDSDGSGTQEIVKVIKHIRMGPVSERKVENKALEREEEATPLATAEEHRESKLEGKDRPGHKRYLIGSDSFIVLEESEAELFRRRGSFLIPQGPPIDSQELVETQKDVDRVVPVVATPRAQWSLQKTASPSKVKLNAGHMQPQPETIYIFTHDSSSEKFYRRRGSFSVHPEDAVGLRGTERDGNASAVQHLVERNADGDSKRESDVASPHTGSPRKSAGLSTSKTATKHMQVKPETIYISTKDSPSHQFSMRRGSFLVHPEDAVNLMGAASSTEGRNEFSVQNVIEHDSARDSKGGVNLRRGSFMLPGVEHDVATTSRERDFRRGSFILVEGASSSPKKNPEAWDQAHGSALRRGSFLLSGVEHEGESSSTRAMDVRRGSFILVEDARSSSKPQARDQTKGTAANLKDDGLRTESTSDRSATPPQHPLSSADTGSESHVAHRWLFD